MKAEGESVQELQFSGFSTQMGDTSEHFRGRKKRSFHCVGLFWGFLFVFLFLF